MQQLTINTVNLINNIHMYNMSMFVCKSMDEDEYGRGLSALIFNFILFISIISLATRLLVLLLFLFLLVW